jgi:hypothetical protein
MAQVYMKIMLPGFPQPSVHGVLYDATSGRPETLALEQGHLNREMPDGAVFVLVVYGTMDHRPFYCSLTAQVKKGEEIHLQATNGSNVIFDIQGAVRTLIPPKLLCMSQLFRVGFSPGPCMRRWPYRVALRRVGQLLRA